jgi:hypothetical protein
MHPFVAGLALSLLLAAAAPAPVAKASPPHRFTHSCDLVVNIADPDPKGVNVRAAPGKPPGAVIAVIPLADEWTEVHVVGQAGEWLLIDRAETVDDDAPEGMREVFRGGGWIHSRGLGISELATGEGTVLRIAPADDAAVVKRIVDYDDEPMEKHVVGCRGEWLEIEADGKRAFTRTWCNNERTTCS